MACARWTVRPGLLQQYQTHLGVHGLAQSTICRKLDALSGFFRYLVGAEIIDRNPLEAVPRSRPKVKRLVWMPEEEARRVLEVVSDPTQRAVFMTLYRAGLRKGELLGLRLGDVDLTERMLTVEARKTRTVRHVPISAESEGFLRVYLMQRPQCASDHFFVSPGHHVPLYSTLLQRWFTRWMMAAGLGDKPYCIHALRHSSAPAPGGGPVDRLAAQLAEAAQQGDLDAVRALTAAVQAPRGEAAGAVPATRTDRRSSFRMAAQRCPGMGR